jgi:hypothetical protein
MIQVEKRLLDLCSKSYHFCATIFRALRTAVGRWDAEEKHRDPSRACICLVPVELTAQTYWDAHSGGFC